MLHASQNCMRVVYCMLREVHAPSHRIPAGSAAQGDARRATVSSTPSRNSPPSARSAASERHVRTHGASATDRLVLAFLGCTAARRRASGTGPRGGPPRAQRLRRAALLGTALQHAAQRCSGLHCVATCCAALQRVALRCSIAWLARGCAVCSRSRPAHRSRAVLEVVDALALVRTLQQRQRRWVQRPARSRSCTAVALH